MFVVIMLAPHIRFFRGTASSHLTRTRFMVGIFQKLSAYLVLTSYICCANAAEWQVIGAGNAKCEHWMQANTTNKTEVLSWMAGFSSAVNIERASEGRPELRLEFLTYDYLRQEIDSTCLKPNNKDERMYSILFKVLDRLPTVKK